MKPSDAALISHVARMDSIRICAPSGNNNSIRLACDSHHCGHVGRDYDHTIVNLRSDLIPSLQIATKESTMTISIEEAKAILGTKSYYVFEDEDEDEISALRENV